MGESTPADSLMWAYLIHLSYNMWGDRQVPNAPYYMYRPYLRCEDSLWNDIIARMPAAGVNTVVIDLGDGVAYQSHPEISVENAWPISKLRDQLARMRDRGLEPIPKLNFSTCHDMWMGPYARKVSTPEYYQFAKDIIAEVIDIFDGPRLFHLGMDEEALVHQRHFEYVVIRQHDLWWRDFQFLLDQLAPRNVRPWIWSDNIWIRPDEFAQRMPRHVLQSNWYYGKEFDNRTEVKAYGELDSLGFDQIPTFSNWEDAENVYNTVRFCKTHIAHEKLKGFFHAPWRPTLEEVRHRHLAALEEVNKAREVFSASD
ncbi:MAG TPA: hypothetical protein VF669_01235 [Tepidisphaeraceae bacterium]